MSNAFKKSFDRIGKLAAEVKTAQFHSSKTNQHKNLLGKNEVDLLNALPDCITLHDENGRVVWVNDKADVVFGRSALELSGLGFLEGINPQDQVALLQLAGDQSEACKNTCIQVRRLKKNQDGALEAKTLECRVSHYNSFLLLTTRDVTSQVQSVESADSRIGIAESANRLKSTFLSTVSHELRTPLNAIIGFSEMLEGKAGLSFSEEAKLEYAGLINQSATHLLNLLNDILDLSKIEAGKFQVLPELFNIEEAMTANMKLVQPIAQKSNVVLSSDFSDDLPMVYADKRAVRQITMNLVANAIKFSSPNDAVTVSISRTARNIMISVADEGIGMDADTLQELGSMFFQAQQSPDREFEGTGLGLSIVKGLVELNNGTIKFMSKKGKGTQVVVGLPLNASAGKPIPADPDSTLLFLNKQEQQNTELPHQGVKKIQKVGY